MEQPAFKTYVIASALIRRGDEILLVHQYRSQDPYPNWFLPGGRVEAGELLSEGLAREVREEAGLDLVTVGQLAYCTHAVDDADHSQSIAFVFEVAEWTGTPNSNDPDGTVSDVRWFSLEEALTHLERVPWHSMREPLVAYLRGTHASGTVWMYAGNPDESQPYAKFAGTMPGAIRDAHINKTQNKREPRS
ncbi:MAG: NUDIX hydrolase [Chloroflexia bacterium]